MDHFKDDKQDTIFRVRFFNEDKAYEIYALSLAQEAILGFLEVEEIIFGENSDIVVDPSEERLKQEFQDVVCTYIPLHSIIRIDEVKKEGTAKILDIPQDVGNNVIRPFPAHIYSKQNKPE